LNEFRREFPERFFMEGISEAHIVGMAAGLAMSGKIPFINTIATFLTRRCFEQSAIDLGMANIPVRLVGSGGGLVYGPLGPTHLALDDIALMRLIPNMSVIAPADADEMERAIRDSMRIPGPVYFRVAKGGDPIVSRPNDAFQTGTPIVLRIPRHAVIFATGVMVNVALRAAEALADKGVEAGVVNVHTIKPLDSSEVLRLSEGCRAIVSVEEHFLHGGLGSAIAEILAEAPRGFLQASFKRIGLPDLYPKEYASQGALLERFGLSPGAVAGVVLEML
jgi:transketolase